jgi:hypothetical protein
MRIFFNNIVAKFRRLLSKVAPAFGGGVINATTELEIKHIRNGKVISTQTVLDKVITTAFVNDIVDALKGDATPYANFKNYKYHASGTGTVNEAVGDTALGTEVGTRATGSQEEGASANIYKSVGTITYAGPFAITEHGLFNAAAAGTLMDRTKFAAVNVISGDSIQFSFVVTFTAGS